MRKSFSQNVPVQEQLSRIVKCHTGRKHQHRKGPGKAATEKQNKRMQANKLQKAKFEKFKKKVKAYWNGEVEEYPK